MEKKLRITGLFFSLPKCFQSFII